MNTIAQPDEYTNPLTQWFNNALVRPVHYIPVSQPQEIYIVPVHKLMKIDRQDFEDQMEQEGRDAEHVENECEDE
jgi:hypothetical protein